ncbi:MAG: hypothetical protein ACOH2K_14005 [Burkholderiaceae bacterium]
MATGKIVVTVVDVGQGQCTFVEIWDTADALAETLLFDCGTGLIGGKSPNIGVNLDYIVARVSSMTPPTFNLVSFSHQDGDHWTLMKTLLEKFTVPKKPVITKVWYAGNRAKFTTNKKKKNNLFKYFVDNGYCTELQISQVEDNKTNVTQATGAFDTIFWENSDKKVQLYLLAGSVLTDTPDDLTRKPTVKQMGACEVINRISLVFMLRYEAKDYFICGDATNRTMAFANYYAKNSVFAHSVMLTLPHHGSRKTAFENPLDGTNNDALTISTFAQLLRAQTLTVSAFQQFSHPSLRLIEQFTPSTNPLPIVKDKNLTVNYHSVYVYFDRALSMKRVNNSAITKYQTFASESNIYGTFCFKKAPTFSVQNILMATLVANANIAGVSTNPHACWAYTTASGGGTTMFGASSLPADGASPNPNIFTAPAAGGGVLGLAVSHIHDTQTAVLPERGPASGFMPAPGRPAARRPALATLAKLKLFK